MPSKVVTDPIQNYILAGSGAAYLLTHEQERAVNYLKSTARRLQKHFDHAWSVYTWDCNRGWCENGNPVDSKGRPDPLTDVRKILDSKPFGAYSIFVLCDYHPFISQPETMTLLRQVILNASEQSKFVVLLSHTPTLPPEIEKLVPVVDFPLPTREELHSLVDKSAKKLGTDVTTMLADGVTQDQLVSSLVGLTEYEAEGALSVVGVRYNRQMGVEALRDIQAEKVQVVRKSGLLEYLNSAEYDLETVGGLEALKRWLGKRKRAFNDIEAAAKYGVVPPRGLLLVGVPGAGKSLVAKSIASSWNLPLLRFDPGRVFASLVGQSEDRIRQVCKLAEALSPAVLWIDEIEKGLAGLQSSGVTDSGVTARVFGTLLTWMQETTAPCLICATANSVGNLPAALIRRFDTVFSVDIPTRKEREVIWNIHITKPRRGHPGRKLNKFDIPALVDASFKLTGAEIEKAYLAALSEAFTEDREVETADIVRACQQIVPIVTCMSEQVDGIRAWAKANAYPASDPDDEPEVEPKELGFTAGRKVTVPKEESK